MLIYCNCSLEKDEGEYQIKEFIKKNKDAELKKIAPNLLDDMSSSITNDGYIRILPNKNDKVRKKDGFFIALLKKKF